MKYKVKANAHVGEFYLQHGQPLTKAQVAVLGERMDELMEAGVIAEDDGSDESQEQASEGEEPIEEGLAEDFEQLAEQEEMHDEENPAPKKKKRK